MEAIDIEASQSLDKPMPKNRKYKTFKTPEVYEKTKLPTWNYIGEHVLDIDQDLIDKFSSESLTVALYGMQEEREAFVNKLRSVNENPEAMSQHNISVLQSNSHPTLPLNTTIYSNNQQNDSKLDATMSGSKNEKAEETGKARRGSEYSRLREENERLMKMLEEGKERKVQVGEKASGDEGCGVQTCQIF